MLIYCIIIPSPWILKGTLIWKRTLCVKHHKHLKLETFRVLLQTHYNRFICVWLFIDSSTWIKKCWLSNTLNTQNEFQVSDTVGKSAAASLNWIFSWGNTNISFIGKSMILSIFRWSRQLCCFIHSFAPQSIDPSKFIYLRAVSDWVNPTFDGSFVSFRMVFHWFVKKTKIVFYSGIYRMEIVNGFTQRIFHICVIHITVAITVLFLDSSTLICTISLAEAKIRYDYVNGINFELLYSMNDRFIESHVLIGRILLRFISIKIAF